MGIVLQARPGTQGPLCRDENRVTHGNLLLVQGIVSRLPTLSPCARLGRPQF
jgi:hypothetical protein